MSEVGSQSAHKKLKPPGPDTVLTYTTDGYRRLAIEENSFPHPHILVECVDAVLTKRPETDKVARRAMVPDQSRGKPPNCMAVMRNGWEVCRRPCDSCMYCGHGQRRRGEIRFWTSQTCRATARGLQSFPVQFPGCCAAHCWRYCRAMELWEPRTAGPCTRVQATFLKAMKQGIECVGAHVSCGVPHCRPHSATQKARISPCPMAFLEEKLSD